MVKVEYDPNGRTGRGEELTSELRTRNGVLQQKWLVTTIGDNKPLSVVEEWRDVPNVEEE